MITRGACQGHKFAVAPIRLSGGIDVPLAAAGRLLNRWPRFFLENYN
jgi:hypothetical protein